MRQRLLAHGIGLIACLLIIVLGGELLKRQASTIAEAADSVQRLQDDFARPTVPLMPPPVPPPVPEEPLPLAWLDIPAAVTAYTPGPESCGVSTDGRTSINRSTDSFPYGIAADPQILPYKTRVLVPGYLPKSYPGKAWEVDDTGGAMRQSWRKEGLVHLDLRYKTVLSAKRWGEQWIMVSVETKHLTAEQYQKLLAYKESFEE